MVSRVKLALEQAEYTALLKMAMSELRSPADQARHIVRQELMRRGYLSAGTSAPDATGDIALLSQDCVELGQASEHASP